MDLKPPEDMYPVPNAEEVRTLAPEDESDGVEFKKSACKVKLGTSIKEDISITTRHPSSLVCMREARSTHMS
ncbi:hypothetical protein DAPPUDRAFT_315327 [Daphnia pulex]|uniref:Uncharacterized protein n=1 Tax=Daphnia pulex TaxID=6669 RepID=E9G9F0_DAPPU|nr:hypothetical protein DAPPUDRAFT_315327 [Daphnia pulex]|eukprot:EFX83887.1 hypothetical protein DAPPUDRAFT_315327 [Daphnia pulex]